MIDSNNKIQQEIGPNTYSQADSKRHKTAGNLNDSLAASDIFKISDIASAYLVKYVPKAAKILDAGAGAGLLGKVLNTLGYKQLTAMETSFTKLAQAKDMDVYSALYQMSMGQELDIPDNFFDAVISVNAFIFEHAPTSSFDELIRITKPSGFIICALPEASENPDLKKKQAILEFENKWELIEASDKIQISSGEGTSTTFQVWVYKVLKQ